VIAFTAGCSANQEIYLDADGTGRAELDIRLDPVFTAYLSDVSAGLGAPEDAPLFDIEAIREEFSDRPGLTLETVVSPERSRLLIELRFESVEQILALEGRSLTRFVRFERTENFRRVAAEIDRRAIERFTALSGIDPLVVDSLMPPDDGMSRREYQDHLAWALEEYARDRSLEEVFRDSRIETRLRPDGEVVRLEGGVVVESGVAFSTSLVDAVIAPTPLRYSLVFVP
jgi:hypothetical protein